MLHQAYLALVLAGVAAFAPVTDREYAKRVVAPHKGKIVVVSFWASYCGPCLEEIPQLQELARKDKDIALVFVDADPKSNEAQSLAVVKKLKLKLESFIVANEDPEPFINAVNPAWAGSVPYTVLYDRAGTRLFALDGQQTPEQISAAIAKAKAMSTATSTAPSTASTP